jgi:hypothetical protein
MDDDEATKEELLAIMRDTVQRLKHHFDAVQVFASFQCGEETHGLTDGVGNWYARVGQVSAWLDRQEPEDSEVEDRD